jgi:hypothetical protein
MILYIKLWKLSAASCEEIMNYFEGKKMPYMGMIYCPEYWDVEFCQQYGVKVAKSAIEPGLTFKYGDKHVCTSSRYNIFSQHSHLS